MILTPILIDINEYPYELQKMLIGANLYDSSSSNEAKVIYIDKNNGYFLKRAPKCTLEREASLTKYFHSLGFATNVLLYVSNEEDWLLTEQLSGNDCIASKYLQNPQKLCDTIAELLAKLHSIEPLGYPINNHTELFLSTAESNYINGKYDKTSFPDSFGYKTADEAWQVVKSESKYLQSDTLLHGDYCLPNIILENWSFSGFVDVGNGGIGDRHVDLFWGAWTLFYNLKTDKFRDRFFDVYGRSKVDQEKLRIVAAVEVFG